MDDLRAGKKAIRDHLLQLRVALSPLEHTARSAAVCAGIRGLPEYVGAGAVLFYAPIRAEVDVSPLFREALGRGITCALPRCTDGRYLSLLAVTDPARDLEPGRFGIPEPRIGLPECTLEEISVILVPGAAYDRQGRRIGYGAGYFDRLLTGSKALKIAPAFTFQVLPDLPHGAYDVPVDVIVTETETIDCRKAGEG